MDGCTNSRRKFLSRSYVLEHVHTATVHQLIATSYLYLVYCLCIFGHDANEEPFEPDHNSPLIKRANRMMI